MGLEILGAGFGRTGTDSLRQALDSLGFGPCDHMQEVMPRPDRIARWLRIVDGADRDWEGLFDGYGAAVDWPAAAFWPELADKYPQSKLILTWRDPDSWYASMDKTILPILRREAPPELPGKFLLRDTFGGNLSREAVIKAYVANRERVQRSFGPDRLLTLELGSGWEPLCHFLGVDVPDRPYPNLNSSDDFRRTMNG